MPNFYNPLKINILNQITYLAFHKKLLFLLFGLTFSGLNVNFASRICVRFSQSFFSKNTDSLYQ
jgi:hypothetical protein